MCGFSKFLASGDSLLAEIWGILLGIQICNQNSFINVFFETDSEMAVKLIHDMNMSSSHYLAPLISSCRSGLNALHSNNKHIFREANACADTLAKRALIHGNDLVIFNDMPPFLSLVVGADLAGCTYSRRIGVG